MKKTALFLAIFAIFSTSSHAALLDQQEKRVIKLDMTGSQEQVLQAAHQRLALIREKSGVALQRALLLEQPGLISSSLQLQDSDVSLVTVSSAPGVIEYRAEINLQYHYRYYEQQR